MLVIALRTVILFSLMFLATRIMGKREIGQLQPFEFVLAIMMADLVTVPTDDVGTPLLYGLIPIMALIVIHLLLSKLSLKNSVLRRFICGRPVLIIAKGKILPAAMRDLRMNMDDLMEQLRLQGYFSPAQVEYAILETGGGLSILPKSGDQTVTRSDLCLEDQPSGLPYCVIADGEVYNHNLTALGISEDKLKRMLKTKGYPDIRNILYASLSENGELFIQEKKEG